MSGHDGLEHFCRSRERAALLQVAGEHDEHTLIGDAAAHDRVERFDRVRHVAGVVCHRCKHAVRSREIGVRSDDRANRVDRFGHRSALEQCKTPVQFVGRSDQLFWIILVAVHPRPWRRGRGDIAERLEALPRVRRQRRALIRCAVAPEGAGGPKQRLERTRAVALRAEQVRRLLRVRVHVVQLGDRQIDQLVVAAHHTSERRPVARDIRVHRLEVCRWRRRIGGRHGGDQRAPFESGRRGDADQIEDRRCDVDEPREFVPGVPAEPTPGPDDEGTRMVTS